MATSDDERREVVKRLRNGGIARDSEEAYVLLLSRVGIRPQLPATSTYEDAMARLADLIDPTCEMVPQGEGFRCSACGTYHDMSGFEEFPWPRCPECGARVVRDVD